MAELIVMVCLVANVQKCEEFTVPGASTTDVVSCIRQGGDKANEWQLQNNKYAVIGWRCVKK
jgi:hypothetical protein